MEREHCREHDHNLGHGFDGIVASGLNFQELTYGSYQPVFFPQQSFGTHSEAVALNRNGQQFNIARRGRYEVAFEFLIANPLGADYQAPEYPRVVLTLNGLPVKYVDATSSSIKSQSGTWSHCLNPGDWLALSAAAGWSGSSTQPQEFLTNCSIMIRSVGDC
ncbi:hypothetical protein AGMMS49992_24520 [Clostridia bacterium]|nr:hypothetical protein AGMMS49992_24520 [Clostridia bacterium]